MVYKSTKTNKLYKMKVYHKQIFENETLNLFLFN